MEANSYPAQSLPSAIYVWLVRSEEVQEQPGSWRIRKWDIEPFPEANFTLSSGPSQPSWRKCEDGDKECKGVHFLRAEAAAGGEVCVTAINQGEFYEYRVKVPPFAVPTATLSAEEDI